MVEKVKDTVRKAKTSQNGEKKLKTAKNLATKQARAGNNGNVPPVERQFGQPNGNKRHNGAWKKEDTLRYKWEQMLKMSDSELREVLNDSEASKVERTTAEVLLDPTLKATEKFSILEKLATQVYGFPKQAVETIDLTPPQPLSPRKQRGVKK